jgi:hypothetical protein
MGRKPGDDWTVPVCPFHHRQGPGNQHSRGEFRFWIDHDIDPLKVAFALYEVTKMHRDDPDNAIYLMRKIVQRLTQKGVDITP